MDSVLVKKSILRGSIKCPPSKSYTHRAVVISSLAEGKSSLINPLRSRDTNATINGCRDLSVDIKNMKKDIVVIGSKKLIAPTDIVNVENSGTSLRFLTPMSALVKDGYTVITGDESIRRRPMKPMLVALQNLGVTCFSTQLNGLAPIVIRGGGIGGGRTRIDGEISSQFLSGLLISGIHAKSRLEIEVKGKQVSRPYIDSTIATMKKYGVKIENSSDYSFFAVDDGTYKGTTFNIPGDFSSAALMLSAGAMLGDNMSISGLDFSLPQGDSKIIEILIEMGAKVNTSVKKGSAAISSCEWFEGGEFDLSDTPDLLPAVSILSLKAKKPIRIFGISHAHFKETDRPYIIATELAKFGLIIRMKEDELYLYNPGNLKSACLDSHNDHRLFMGFVIAGMLTSGSIIRGAQSVDVSYPRFMTDLNKLGANILPMDS